MLILVFSQIVHIAHFRDFLQILPICLIMAFSHYIHIWGLALFLSISSIEAVH